MKGIFYNGKHQIEVKNNLPKPSINSDEILIKVKYCGICGSDMESYETGLLEKPGIIIGHEFSGQIAEIGENVKGFKIGDRVTANPGLPCESCYWCNHNQENMCKWASCIGTTFDGAMAEFVNIRSDRVFKLPENVSFREAAVIEPLCVAIHAVQDSGFQIGQNVAVFGAGGIGLLVIKILELAGASEIYVVEPIESKRNLAIQFGATDTYTAKNWTKINRKTKNIGPDHIFDCVGIPETFINSINLVKRGGQINVVGIHAESFKMTGFMALMIKSITMKGIYGYLPNTWHTALKLLERGKIDLEPMISEIVNLDDAPKVFEGLSKENHEKIKVLIKI